MNNTLEHMATDSSYGVSNLKNLLDNFHISDIQYCHFKSNAHVLAGMVGSTDLDILIDRNSYTECVGFLNTSGF